MEPANIVRELISERIVDLVKKRNSLTTLVAESNSCALRKWHLQPEIHSPAHSNRVNSRLISRHFSMSKPHEVAQRTFNAGISLAIPISAHHNGTERLGHVTGSHPVVADHAGPFYIA